MSVAFKALGRLDHERAALYRAVRLLGARRTSRRTFTQRSKLSKGSVGARGDLSQ